LTVAIRSLPQLRGGIGFSLPMTDSTALVSVDITLDGNEPQMNVVGHYLITFGRSADLPSSVASYVESRIGSGPVLVMDNNPEPVDSTAFPADVTHIDICRNVGPAGAGRLAVLLLAAQGCDFVAGGDDDRVGGDSGVLRRCHQTLVEAPSDVAAASAYGSFYSDRFSRQTKPSVAELARIDQEDRLLEVDVVGGGRASVWRVEPFRHVGLQRPELFFGKEDFELGSRVRRGGFRMLVIPDLMIPQLEQELARIATGTATGPVTSPWRRYYNSRNSTYLAVVERRPISALLALVARLGSIFIRTRVPWRLRLTLAWHEFLGFRDGALFRMGETVSPQGYV